MNSKTDELVDSLQELQDNAERDIWELHNLAVRQNIDDDNHEDENEAQTNEGAEPTNPNKIATAEETEADAENTHPNLNLPTADQTSVNKASTTSSAAATKSSNPMPSKKRHQNLFINILSGPHEGATFLLKPRPSRPCEIGRSRSKKFVQRGISLSKDSEVSTCHGKFEAKGGKMFYTDTGSTNGTSYMGEAIEDNVPLELNSGMVLVFGESELEFSLVDN